VLSPRGRAQPAPLRRYHTQSNELLNKKRRREINKRSGKKKNRKRFFGSHLLFFHPQTFSFAKGYFSSFLYHPCLADSI
jgi:hypothetical protein